MSRWGSAGCSVLGGTSLRHEDYAGLVSRLLAVAVDVAIATVGIALAVALAVGAAEMTLGQTPDWVVSMITVAAGMLPTLYFAASWWIGGQTVGDMVMGIAVRRPNGESMRFPRSLVRAILGLAFAPFWLLGLVLTLIDNRRRGLLDVVAGTVVVYAPTGTGRR